MKKVIYVSLVFVGILLLASISAMADMPAYDPVPTVEQQIQMRTISNEIYSDLSCLWEYYVDDYANVADEDQLLYETLVEKIRVIYHKDDWQTLKDDLLNCYNQKYEQRDPSWDTFQAILRKEYAGITQGREGYPKREQIMPQIHDYLLAVGFDEANMPNFSCYYSPYYEAYQPICTVAIGRDSQSMLIRFNLNMSVSGHTDMEVHRFILTEQAPTEQQLNKAESIVKAFWETYPHPFGIETGEVQYGKKLGKIGNDNVIQLAIFMGNLNDETLAFDKPEGRLDDKYACLMIGLDSSRIYEYVSMAKPDYLK